MTTVPYVMTLPSTSLAGPTWARPARRTRPGRRPLPVDIARAGRVCERWWSGQVDEPAALAQLVAHLAPGLAVDIAQVSEVLRPALDYLRAESSACRTQLDTTCACEVESELCQACWTALGSWWSHQLIHLSSVRDTLRSGVATNCTT